ncbi:MAG: cupin domain-containing protein [Chitinophagaceae bacterium]|nr:cupin domain-containing protein [Chitinophagaceae bacterium]
MAVTTETASVFSPAERIQYSKDSIVSQQITKNKAGNITLFAFDEGQQLSEHSAPFDAVVQIVDGSAEIHIAGEPYHLQAGEMIILPANIPHAVYATTRFKMLLTMIRS